MPPTLPPTWTEEGSVDENAILVGDWSEIIATITTTDYLLGNCPEGALEISHEYYEHVSTSFPRTVDLVIPTRVGMKFSGNLEELHRENVSLLVGKTLAPTSNYVYIGAQNTPQYFTLSGRRLRNSDGAQIVFTIFKCRIASIFTLAGGDEAIQSPFEAMGLDDRGGDYGGSAAAPLGYLYVPPKTP